MWRPSLPRAPRAAVPGVAPRGGAPCAAPRPPPEWRSAVPAVRACGSAAASASDPAGPGGAQPARAPARAARQPEGSWQPTEVKDVLRQLVAAGALERPLAARLREPGAGGRAEAGGEAATTGSAEAEEEQAHQEAEAEDAGGAGTETVECGAGDLLRAAELCNRQRVRDFVLLGLLAERLVPELKRLPTEALLRLGAAYAGLGALNAPLFQGLAAALLAAWPAPGGGARDGSVQPPAAQVSQVVQAARAFSAQRARHEELFDRLAGLLEAHGVAAATPAEALSLLHSHAFLRLGEGLGDLWPELEAHAASLDGLGPLAELCYVLFLSRRAEGRFDDVVRLLERISGPVLDARESVFSTGNGPALHRRLLLLRAAVRYLHREAYGDLPEPVKRALRRVHRLELPPPESRPVVSFVRKLSAVLTKMKVGHRCLVEKGPFTLDVLERDRKLAYECNHFDRFYSGPTAGTTEKIAAMCLQERIVKAMGYRVIQIPHWQWNKVRHRRQRTEYLRMSRYYAIKDRRELPPRDEAPHDVAANEFDHLGEYFFRKAAPATAWSWFQPRVDAKRRLPTPAAAATAAAAPAAGGTAGPAG